MFDYVVVPDIEEKLAKFFRKDIKFIKLTSGNKRNCILYRFKIGDYEYDVLVDSIAEQIIDILYIDDIILTINNKITPEIDRKTVTNLVLDEFGIKKENISKKEYFKDSGRKTYFLPEANSQMFTLNNNEKQYIDIIFRKANSNEVFCVMIGFKCDL